MPERWNWVDWTAITLVIIGALNWGLIGFFGIDLIAGIFGGGFQNTFATGPRIIYAIVGLAGLWAIYSAYKVSRMQSRLPAAERERMRRAA